MSLVAFYAVNAEPNIDSVVVVQVKSFQNSSTEKLQDSIQISTEQPLSQIKVHVNYATTKELQKISGIGVVLADRIISSRESAGPFSSVGDLQRVKGIGKKRCETLSHHVIID